MKTKFKILTIILLTGNILMSIAQQLDRMPTRQRESMLIATAKEIVMKYGPDYYREYKPPVIERNQVPPKGEFNPTGELAGRIRYFVLFLYNKEEEQLEYDFAVRVAFWEDTGNPCGIIFGNGWSFSISDDWRTEMPIEQNPYQERQIFPEFDLNNPDTNQEPRNKDELIRKGYERKIVEGREQWVKTRPDTPPAEAQRVIRQAKEDMRRREMNNR